MRLFVLAIALIACTDDTGSDSGSESDDLSCTVDGVVYEDGESVPSDDCNECSCDGGSVSCTERECDTGT